MPVAELCDPETHYGASDTFSSDRSRPNPFLAANPQWVVGFDSPELASAWSEGRFTAIEPLLRTRHTNNYIYAANRPTSVEDRTGLSPISIVRFREQPNPIPDHFGLLVDFAYEFPANYFSGTKEEKAILPLVEEAVFVQAVRTTKDGSFFFPRDIPKSHTKEHEEEDRVIRSRMTPGGWRMDVQGYQVNVPYYGFKDDKTFYASVTKPGTSKLPPPAGNATMSDEPTLSLDGVKMASQEFETFVIEKTAKPGKGFKVLSDVLTWGWSFDSSKPKGKQFEVTRPVRHPLPSAAFLSTWDQFISTLK